MSTPLLGKSAEWDAVTPRCTSWRLTGARVGLDARHSIPATVDIREGRIREIVPEQNGGSHRLPVRSLPSAVDLSGYLLLPGLINAHEHLEFNLFPRLGNGPYRNYAEWAADVYHPERSPVRDQLMIPKPVRLWWGAIKNLLAGVTTVCHHNAPIPRPLNNSLPVRVLDRYGWSHSLCFSRNISEAFHATPPDAPFVIHLGEGTDEASRDEIFRLDRLGALDSRTAIVHGTGLDEAGHKLLEQRGAGLIWCPTSNIFTLGTTLGKEAIARHSRVALGSDSALTAQSDLLDEIRFARQKTQMTPEAIYPLVTTSAADVLRLANSAGVITAGGPADLIAVADTGDPPCERLAQITIAEIELGMVGGEPKLLSPAAAARWPRFALTGHQALGIDGIERLIQAPVASLMEITKQHCGREIFLAARMVEV